MRRFSKSVLVPYIKASGYQKLCEIGSEGGDNIDRLLSIQGLELCSIDPCVRTDLMKKYENNARMRVCKGLSLEVLPTFAGQQFDCIMIDGDHNWYTVFHELELIDGMNLLAQGGTIFLHDVGWPHARRDMYYNLETVPAEFRQPASKQGILRGVSALSKDPNRGRNGELWNATHEGGPRNGVLTAVEDFIQAHPGYRFFSFHKEWGLGVLTRADDRRAVLAQLQRKARFMNAAEALKTAVKTVTGRLDEAH